MSVVKDAERLGDYAKNLFQVSKLLKKPIEMNLFSSLFNHTDEEELALITINKKAFINPEKAKAKQCWEFERKIVKECDGIIEKLAKGDLGVNEAVCFALIARYFKRTAAHLTNIATSVILPISELDYFDEDRRKEDE